MILKEIWDEPLENVIYAGLSTLKHFSDKKIDYLYIDVYTYNYQIEENEFNNNKKKQWK